MSMMRSCIRHSRLKKIVHSRVVVGENNMQSMHTERNVVVLGAGGAIGSALCAYYSCQQTVASVTAFLRKPTLGTTYKIKQYTIDYTDEQLLAQAAAQLAPLAGIDLIFITTGILHDDETMPEKSLQDVSAHGLQKLYLADTVIPALLTKHFSRYLAKDRPAIIALLSARVGSISDNQLGGWYAYRCAKSALNMLIKTAAIELNRRYKQQMVIGIHPGTVHSPLSAPFQARLDPKKIFSPGQSAAYIAEVITQLQPYHNGSVLAWDGQVIAP